jgi:hypothetical protein
MQLEQMIVSDRIFNEFGFESSVIAQNVQRLKL